MKYTNVSHKCEVYQITTTDFIRQYYQTHSSELANILMLMF